MLDDLIVQGIENAKQVYNMYVSSCILLLEWKRNCRIYSGYQNLAIFKDWHIGVVSFDGYLIKGPLEYR